MPSGAVTGAGTGAASGAAAGTAIMPGWGTAIGAGVGAIGGGIMGFAGDRKAKRAREGASAEYSRETGALSAAQHAPANYLQQIDPNSPTAQLAQQRLAMGSPMSPEEVAASLQNDQVTKQRSALTQQVNGFFDNPGRQAAEQQSVQAQLQQALGGIGDQYRQQYTQGAQHAGDRGLLGSSVDIEGRAAAGQSRDLAAGQAGQSAQSALQQFQGNDIQQRQQLLQLVNSQDPGTAQQAQSQLQALQSQTGGITGQTGVQQQGMQLGQFGMNNTSQALGQGVGAINGQLQMNPGLLSSFGRTGSRGG